MIVCILGSLNKLGLVIVVRFALGAVSPLGGLCPFVHVIFLLGSFINEICFFVL